MNLFCCDMMSSEFKSGKRLKTTNIWNIWEIEILIIEKNQFPACIEVTKIGEK